MVEKLSCYCLHTSTDVEVFVIAGSVTEAVKLYLKSTGSVDESVILNVHREIKEVLV